MQITQLIKSITPLYNKYKQNKDSLSGKESLYLMWEIGELLKLFIEHEDVAPHNLYRQIYGKSEGKENVAQKSYITREFLGRCYRIRNIFSDTNTIETLLPKLKDFTVFREAMPFFDNLTYKLDEKDFKNLLVLLNGNEPSSNIIQKLDVKKKSKNNITNPRTQKLQELESEKKSFISFYNFIYNLKSTTDYANAIDSIGMNSTDSINLISKNLSALAQEGILSFELPEIEINNSTTKDFYYHLKKLIAAKDEKNRRRFRRIISPERIIKLAEMVYVFTSEVRFQNSKMR